MPSMPSFVTRWCPLLQLLHRIPQLREISRRKDRPFGDVARLQKEGSWWNQHAALLHVAPYPSNRFTCAWTGCDDPAFYCVRSSKNPAFTDRVIVLLGDGLVAVSPIHKATPTATVAPSTASVAPAATVAPSTSIAGIREATTASIAVSPATSATVTPSSELQRLVQL